MREDLLQLDGVRKVNPDECELIQVLRPSTPGQDLVEWLNENAETVREQSADHTLLLFRGFSVGSPANFEKAISLIVPEFNTEYGDLSHKVQNTNFVQEATPYPDDLAILFHNEASHTPGYPERICFFCQVPAAADGETPILPCDEVLDRLPADVRDEFATRGLRYIRNFIPGLDVPWERFFATTDRESVEQQCRENGTEFFWREDGGLRIETNRPAIVRHPRSGAELFFNQILLHHPAVLDEETREDLFALCDGEYPRSVVYGDGTEIPDEVIETVLQAEVDAAICFDYEPEDVVVCDNIAFAHARRRYTPPRSIRVLLSRFVGDEILMQPA
jgi:hypothetical protein